MGISRLGIERDDDVSGVFVSSAEANIVWEEGEGEAQGSAATGQEMQSNAGVAHD